jgi:hypothetical protein
MQLDDNQLQRLNELGRIIEQTTNMERPRRAHNIQLAENRLTKQQKDAIKLAKKKKREGKPLTQEEKAAIEAERAAKEAERREKENRISILRGIALRIPLLIYGANVDDEEIGITIDNLTEQIDDCSWGEFMPRGITKEIFKEIKPCFNAKMFALAGKRYRQLAREADEMHTDERVKRIAEIFGYFHNPDKETVLTPWRVVNMHMSNTLGGYCFYNEKFDGPNQKVINGTEGRLFDYVDTTEPRYVDRDQVSADVFNTSTRILEINSKTGLYPLYITYSIYRQRMKDFAKHDLIEDVNNYSVVEEQVIWDDIVKNNIYVICNTPMAARITERTLLGFRTISGHNIKEDTLVENATSNSANLVNKLKTVGYWNNTDNESEMKFNAIVGNPPYQQMTIGHGAQASAIYPDFIEIARKINPQYISMITPSRWMSKMGIGIKASWVDDLIKCNHFIMIYDYLNATECFPGVEIKGGVNYFLYSSQYSGKCSYNLYQNKKLEIRNGYLDQGYGIIIRDAKATEIVAKVNAVEDMKLMEQNFSQLVGPLHYFDRDEMLGSNWQGYVDSPDEEHRIKCYVNRQLEPRGYGWCKLSDIPKSHAAIQLNKIYLPKAGGSGNDPIVLGKPILGEPGSVCSFTYLCIGYDPNNHNFTKEECENIISYMRTRFFRYMVSIKKKTQDNPSGVFQFVPLQDWSKPCSDAELYKKYNLNNEEIAYIESMIKPME